MAVIKCSLKENGQLNVLEILEFERGDVIQVDKSTDAQIELRQDLVVGIIPCPTNVKGHGRFDCWMCVKGFDLKHVVTKKPDIKA
jgi:hypothetical protein